MNKTLEQAKRDVIDDGCCDVAALMDEIERLHGELYRTKMEVSEARLEERQAMAYLSAIQKIVGGESYPDMIELVRKQNLEKTHFMDAWSDMCDENQRLRNEFDADEELLRTVLDNICGAKLCEINSMSSRIEMIRLMDEAIQALRERLK